MVPFHSYKYKNYNYEDFNNDKIDYIYDYNVH